MNSSSPDILTLILVSLVPGLLWVAFFYRQDKYEPEPKYLVIRSFTYGAIAVLPAIIVELPFREVTQAGPQNLLRLALVTILVVGVAEESFKLLAVRLAAYENHAFNEVMDGIVYSVSSGLGFAALENLLYASAFGATVGLVRAFVTCLAHASFSGISGYYLGKAKLCPEAAVTLVARGLGIAIVLHGLYDFLIIGRIVPAWSAIFLVAAVYRYLASKVVKAQESSPFRE
ncbi:MAG TPA: PrsW family intramembrane metalloprotease [Firmicutes bacterium]|nr:PrsW family intramembrane metalloprotease [Bacillota bacterium]